MYNAVQIRNTGSGNVAYNVFVSDATSVHPVGLFTFDGRSGPQTQQTGLLYQGRLLTMKGFCTLE